MRYNLHIHSRNSDGKCSCSELIELIRGNLDIVSLTDHDTMSGVPEFLKACLEIGVVCIPGVEISSKVDKCFEFVNPSDVYSLHILAYFPKSIYANFDIGKIKLLKEHKPNVFETLEFIHGIGGISVLAHPTRGVKKNTDPTTQLNKYTNISIPLIVVEKIIDTCVKNGLDGIEAYYEANSEDETAFLVSIAKKYDLLTSQGTDFHKFGDCITSKYDDTIKHDLIIKKLL